MYKIYGLTDLKTGNVFYVGSTRQKYISKRKCGHVERAREGKRTAKLYKIIRDLNFEIGFTLLEEFEGNEDYRWEKEQEWIDKLKPSGNTQSAKGKPPFMGGHNRIDLPKKITDKLGKMPDYELAFIAGVGKKKIMIERHKRKIPSYAKTTGNDGKIKKGEPHRRWR